MGMEPAWNKAEPSVTRLKDLQASEISGRGTPIEVHRLSSLEEYRCCEDLQSRVWGPEDVVRVPALVMITAGANGGFAFGAFAEGKLVGFVLSFPGLTKNGKVKQASVLMAVDPTYRNAGIGYDLKLAQRNATLAQGLDLITWTFDPLASANAHLNLQKLGCVTSQYYVDIYGTAERGLNAGLPTDRLLAEWWIREPAVVDRLAKVNVAPPHGLMAVDEVVHDSHLGFPLLHGIDLHRTEPALLVEIPGDIRAVKVADLELARRWRMGLREIFQHYFARGYRATGFHRLPSGDRVRHCFLLERVI